MKNAKLQSLEGFMWGCPICGGHSFKRTLVKRGRAKQKRLWKKMLDDDNL